MSANQRFTVYIDGHKTSIQGFRHEHGNGAAHQHLTGTTSLWPRWGADPMDTGFNEHYHETGERERL